MHDRDIAGVEPAAAVDGGRVGAEIARDDARAAHEEASGARAVPGNLALVLAAHAHLDPEHEAPLSGEGGEAGFVALKTGGGGAADGPRGVGFGYTPRGLPLPPIFGATGRGRAFRSGPTRVGPNRQRGV